MFSLLQFLVKSRFKDNPIKKPPSIRGYTMIELLVGMVMAFLIITPLMGFVLNLLDDDRKEGVRATTDQELQSAMDYIQEDLRQAFYVYDRTGVQDINDDTGIKQTDRTPILVFWKRKIEEDSRPVVTIKNGICSPTVALDDSFVYSLVAYYVSTNNPNGIWSDKAVRIERLEISDGVQYPCDSSKYVSGFLPSDGFQKFTQDKWNDWTKGQGSLDSPTVLIDYIHSESRQYQYKDGNLILLDKSVDEKSDVDCQNILESKDILAAIPPSTYTPTSQLITQYLVKNPPAPPPPPPEVPPPPPPASSNKVNQTDPGFSVCVNTEKKIVQVNLRGNALARMGETDPRYSDSKKQFFPRSSTAIQLGSSLDKVKKE
jgi:hypothetical protein